MSILYRELLLEGNISKLDDALLYNKAINVGFLYIPPLSALFFSHLSEEVEAPVVFNCFELSNSFFKGNLWNS